MSSLIFNPSNNGNGSVSVNVFGDDENYNLTLPNTNGTLVSSVNGKTAQQEKLQRKTQNTLTQIVE